MQISANTAKAIYNYAHKMLDRHLGEKETTACIKRLFEAYAQLSFMHFLAEPETRFSESEILRFLHAIRELARGMPLQYILGKSCFCGMDLMVSPQVLIPRPETEELVQLICKNHTDGNIAILDIGTGSGCIAIALKKNMTATVNVVAMDVSQQALDIASQNAMLTATNVSFVRNNILENTYHPDNDFDIIVSNPPYVCESEKPLICKQVKDFEPSLALFVPDAMPLIYYDAIGRFAKEHLKPTGKLYLEINESLGNETQDCLSNFGFETLLTQDLFGKDRFVIAWQK